MKALTISQPYASLIADGEKWVENRRWSTSYRGPLAIHAGKGTQYLDRGELAAYPTGCVVAVAQLAACVLLAGVQDRRRGWLCELGSAGFDADIFLAHEYTEGPWCWVLCDVRKLADPVYCRGAQGLWTVAGLEFGTNLIEAAEAGKE